MTGEWPLIRVLGPVGLGARHLTRQELLLLAVLAAHRGRPVGVDRFVDALWPERPPGSARNRIQSSISSLRRSLPAGTIATSHGGYVLRDPSTLDAARFEELLRRTAEERHLEEALELWRGNAFEDALIPATEAEAQRLTELRYAAIEELYERRLATNRAVTIADLARHVDAAPLRQRLRGLLMTALHRTGRQVEALATYRAAARLLTTEHGLDPSPELSRLYESILRDDPPSSPADVPRQLPASPPEFTGRHSELSYIRKLVAEAAGRAAAPGTSLVVAISGMAGVGKTALAIRAAHDVQPQFTGGCLYANLHGTDSPVPPAHVLDAFLRACGVAGSALPSNVEERAALYRTLLAEREVLVVLDNAAGEEQVEPLLPGAGGTVLLTSRRPLTGLAGARLLQLDVLAADDAIDLLGAVAGRDRVAMEPIAAQRIPELCGGLPLAVRVVAVRLAANDKLSLRSLTTRLADERERLDELALGDVDVRASLAISCRQLTANQALLWEALSVLPLEEIPFVLVPPMLGVSDGQAHRLLEDLAAAQLIGVVEQGRYQIHDLLRILGRELAGRRDPGEVDRLIGRALRHLWELVRQADAALPCRPIPPSVASVGAVPAGVPYSSAASDATADPMEFLERELANIVSVIRFAVSNGDGELAAGLASCLTNFCLMRGYTDQWEQGQRLVLERPHGVGRRAMAAVELGMGTLQRIRDHNRESLAHLRRAYLGFRREGDHLGQGVALLSWAIAARTLGRPWIAAQATASSAAIFEALPGPPVQAGYVLMAQHHLCPDPDLLRRALELFEAHAEDWGAAEVHSLLADSHLKAGQPGTAEHHVRRGMDLYARFGDRVNHLVMLLQLAQIHLARGEHDAAEAVLSHARPAAQHARHAWCLAKAHRLTGQLLLCKDDAPQALSHLQRAEAILRPAGLPLGLALVLEQAAYAYERLGEHRTAEAHGREAHELLLRLRPQGAAKLSEWLAGGRTSEQGDHSIPKAG